MYLNFILAFYLILALPTMQILLNRNSENNKNLSRAQRYKQSILRIVLPLAALFTYMNVADVGFAELGFDVPVSIVGTWGLIAAFSVLLIMAVSGLKPKSANDKTQKKFLDQVNQSEIMPRSVMDLNLCILMNIILGIGWEILYRGFLMFMLTPIIGIYGAIVLASFAYALAHGYQNRKQIIGSIISAFLFAIGYALTKSLWWLIVLHIGLPVISAVICFKAFNSAANAFRQSDISDGHPAA